MGARELLSPGASLGRFKIVEPIGTGAMGDVYTAHDPDLGRTVAIKVLHDEQARARLIREAQAMARLAHPNVVPVHEIGSGEPLFLVMELVAGGTLRQWLAEPRRIEDIVDAFEQAGRGLAAAHAAGLVHRDFKPENILRGGDGRIRVVDFGLVAARGDGTDVAPVVGDGSSLDLALTHTGFVLGTPAYMSPEQHRGEVADARSDQFSFAVAFYEALYGERPFAGDKYREMVRNVYAGIIRPAPATTGVPDALRGLLLRALATDPAQRFPSMTALLEALARPLATPVSALVAAPARRSRRGVALVAACVVALGAIATVIALEVDDRAPAPPTSPVVAPAAQPAVHVDVAAPEPAPPPSPAIEQPGPEVPAKTVAAPVRAKDARRTPTPPPSTEPLQPAATGSDDAAAERRRRQLELSE